MLGEEAMRKIFGNIIIVSILMIIFWFSSKPVETSLSQSNGFLVTIGILTQEDVELRTNKYIFWANGIRKMAHLGLYAVLGIGTYLVTESIKKSILTVFIVGSIDEIYQYFIPGRGAQFKDVVIDTLGGSTGALLTKVFLMMEEIIKKKN